MTIVTQTQGFFRKAIHFLRRNWILVLFCFAIFLLRTFTSARGPITWDEPVYLNASRSYANWFVLLVKSPFEGNIVEVFSKDTINQYWQRHLPSTPFAKTMNGLTWLAFRPFFDGLTALRMGSAFFYSLLIGIVIYQVKSSYGTFAGIISGLALVMNPRLFSHAGTANPDIIGMVITFIALLYFWKTAKLPGWKITVVCGILWGLSVSAKHSALLVFPVFIIWTLLWCRTRQLFLRIALMQVIGFVVFFAVWPWLYHDTLTHLGEFSQWSGITNMSRKVENVFSSSENHPLDRKLEKQFGASSSGIRKDGKARIPWHYPFDVIGVVLPAPTLLLWLGGVFVFLRHPKDNALGFFFLGSCMPLVITALPGVPIYDMERFLLISMPFIAILAGSFVAFVARHLNNRWNRLRTVQFVSLIVVFLAYVPCMREWRAVHPIEFSYFNEFAGGLHGAVEKGFPRNYWLQSYWGALPYINEHLPENAILAAEEDNVLIAYQQFGMLREDILPCRGTNAASLKKCEYFLKREPLNETIKSTTDVLFTFSLEGVPLSSVYTITPVFLEEKKKKEREERIKKNRLKRKATERRNSQRTS